MPAFHVLASFRRREDAQRGFRYAKGRYPEAGLRLSGPDAAMNWPYSISIQDLRHQIAIAFVKGFAYALPRTESVIDEVMMKGDERDRYDRPRKAAGQMQRSSRRSR